MIQQPAPGALVLLCGLPGAGKSTLAQRIATSLQPQPVTILRSDEIRKELFPTPGYTAVENYRVHQTVRQRMLAPLRRGDLVIYDATNLTEAGRRAGLTPARRLGAPTLIVEVVAAESIIFDRLRQRQQIADAWSDADQRVYQLLKQTQQPIHAPHLTIHTDAPHESDWLQLLAHLRQLLHPVGR